MEFDKNITMEELVKIHDEIMVRFTQSDEPVENAEKLTEAALKTTEESISELLVFISVLNKECQNKVATMLQKIVAATYLSAVAEVIKNKQEFNDGLVAYRLASKYMK